MSNNPESPPPGSSRPIQAAPTANGASAAPTGVPPGSPPASTAPLAHGPTGAGRQGDLTLEELVRMIRTGIIIVRNRWIPGVTGAIIVGTILGFLLLRGETEHTAVTTLLAQSPLDQILKTDPREGARFEEQENVLRNHISVLRSRRFSVQLAKEFTREEVSAVSAPYLAPEQEEISMAEFEQLLAGMIGASRDRGLEFFTLSATHIDPDVAVMIADRMAATYLKLIQEEFRQANLSAAAVFRQQAKALQEEITKLEDRRRDYRKDNNIISVEENQGILAERLRRIDQNRADVRIRRVRIATQLAEAERAIRESPTPYDNPLLAGFANNQQLRQELDRLDAQREVLASRYGSRHPKMRDIDASRRGVQENIVKNFDLALRDLRSQLDDARTIENQLEKEFLEAFGETIDIGRLASHYLILGSEIAAKRTTLDELLRNVNRAGVSSELPADVMRVVDPAYIAEPGLPRIVTRGAFVLFCTIATLICIPLGLHVFDERIKAGTDVEKVLAKELLGGIRHISQARPDHLAHVVRDSLDQESAEAFMSLVAHLELTTKDTLPKSFIVTSTIPGEGKSVIASNLAAGFTRIGRRTLIVDCDLRRPVQQDIHGIPPGKGLLSWAAAGFPEDDLFGPDSPLGIQKLTDGTDLILAGGSDIQPAHFLVSTNTARLFEKLKHRYEVLIIDTPPAALFQDALVLSRYARHTLLVAREATAPAARIRRTIEDIDKTSAPVLGIVLNGHTSSSLNPRIAYRYSYGRYDAATRQTQKEPSTVE